MAAALLADLNKDSSATAQGACSFVRCLLAGAAIAAMEPLAQAAGLGWFFALYAALFLIEALVAWIVVKNRPRWRKEKLSSD